VNPANKPVGVLVMAYGGPASLEEIPGYLADIRAGRTTSRAILEEITANYRAIGGRSPLPEKTAAQIAALAARFDPAEVKFYPGMRHWSPWIEDAVAQMADDGVERAVSLVLAPHFSRESIAKYQARIARGEVHRHVGLDWRHIESYHDEPALIDALASRVTEGLSRWSEDEWESVYVVFSAHALPARILAEGDPYQDQLWETARLVAARSGVPDHRRSWAYQSAGRTPEPWLGPTYEQHLDDLAARGVKNIVAVAVGFVSDHVEILFDLDIKAQEKARALGIRLERPAALNDDPRFIDALEAVVRRRLAGWP
jgi:ferrochelatase